MLATVRRNADWGRPSADTSEGMADLWRSAADLNTNLPGNGEWVPWRAIEVRREILPRREQEPDAETVERYTAVIDVLPPLRVQRDTFVLIDGHHRLTAAPLAMRDHVRIVEVDVADKLLRLEAFKANVGHGRPLTLAERRDMARWLIETYPDGPEGWTDREIAEVCSLHRHTVAALRPRGTTAMKDDKNSQTADPHIVADAQPELMEWPDTDEEVEPAESPEPAAQTSRADFAPTPAPPPVPGQVEASKVAADYAAAAVLFRDYTPEAFAVRIKVEHHARYRAIFAGWREWLVGVEAELTGK